MAWSLKNEHCINCGTIARRHHGAGYCRQCYPYATWITDVEAWDQRDSQTLKRMPEGGLYIGQKSCGKLFQRSPSDEFEAVRNGVIKQLRQHLVELRQCEEYLLEIVELIPFKIDYVTALQDLHARQQDDGEP